MSPDIAAEKISLREARRIAIAAQGLHERRPAGAVTPRHLHKALHHMGLLQIDSVNVLTRMHYLPLFSRLGAYPRALLDEAAWGQKNNRLFYEYWAHEASLLPLGTQPLLRWRMAQAERGEGGWGSVKAFAGERRAEAEVLLKRIETEGPMAASDIGGSRGSGGWWGWSDAKKALEWLFWSGFITTRTRRASFERVYDLTERVLPPSILQAPTPEPADAHRALLAIAARSLGIATVKDLRDYFRQPPEDAKPRVAELVETGELIPVAVEGWSQLAYLQRDAARPRRLTAQALLAPFDPLIWERSRTERLFGVRYRIEIYTPADKREHGYYVLPFLMDQALVARVDLKADRAAGLLRVQASHAEPKAPAQTAARLAEELKLMAGWLGLGGVAVEPKGDLAAQLALSRA
jgi:uncharacterized protein YcaQ